MGTTMKPTTPKTQTLVIPDNRPVIGQDVLFLQNVRDSNLMDITWELGWYNNRHNTTTVDKQNQPLSDITRALLIRMYAHAINCEIYFHSPKHLLSYGMIPEAPSFKMFHDAICAHLPELEDKNVLEDYFPENMMAQDYRPNHSSALIGFNGNSAIRWLTTSSEPLPGPVARRLTTMLYADIHNRGAIALLDYLHHVSIEANARKIPNGIKGVLLQEKWAAKRYARRGRPSSDD